METFKVYINITASPNMTTFGEIPDHPRDKKYISVEVTNTGAQKTTINSFYYLPHLQNH